MLKHILTDNFCTAINAPIFALCFSWVLDLTKEDYCRETTFFFCTIFIQNVEYFTHLIE